MVFLHFLSLFLLIATVWTQNADTTNQKQTEMDPFVNLFGPKMYKWNADRTGVSEVSSHFFYCTHIHERHPFSFFYSISV